MKASELKVGDVYILDGDFSAVVAHWSLESDHEFDEGTEKIIRDGKQIYPEVEE